MKLGKLFVLSLFILGMVVCGFSQQKGISPLGKIKKLSLAIIPTERPEDLKRQFEPLRAYVEKQLGMPVEMFVATDYSGVIEAMRAGKVHVGFLGPASYVLARGRANAEAFAVYVVTNEKFPQGIVKYNSYIMANSEIAKEIGLKTTYRGIEGMKELKKLLSNYKKKYSFAFTDPASTSGCVAPSYYMKKADLDPKEIFSSVGYVGSHEASIVGVANNTINFGASNSDDLALVVGKGKADSNKIVIAWISPDLPMSPIAIRKDFPKDLKKKVIEAFLSAPGELFSAPGLTYKGFVAVDDKMFDPVVEMFALLSNQ